MAAGRRAWVPDVDALLASHERVVSHHQLRATGMPTSSITDRIALAGPWQRSLPGVVIAHRGTPTRRERLLSALRYGGDGAVVSGHAALREHGVKAARGSDEVLVLVPAARRRQSYGFVRAERSTRMPEPVDRRGIPVAPVARAVVDACRRTEDLDEVRAVVAEAVQTGRCTVREVGDAVRGSARARTGLTRAVLDEVAAGIRSVAEARAREVYERCGVPMPEWNCDLLEADGSCWARPDGLWRSMGAVLLIDSMAWHLSPAAYQRTQRKHRDYAERSVAFLPVAPSLVIDEPEEFVRSTLAFLREAGQRPGKPVLHVRAAAR